MAVPVAALIDSVHALWFELEDLPTLQRPDTVALVRPDYYDIEEVLNPHMEGNLGGVNRFLARQQWLGLLDAYRGIGVDVEVWEPFAGLSDQVFCANVALPLPPYPSESTVEAVPSIMAAVSRAPEVPEAMVLLEQRGIDLLHLDPYAVARFEGTGDAIWHPERRLLFGGVGPRSVREAYDRIAAWTHSPVLLLSLVDPHFYHLDTCFLPLSSSCAVFYPEAFDAKGQAVLRHFFSDAVEVDRREAMRLACNGHCPDGRHVLLDSACEETASKLAERGFEPVLVDTGEFLKSGGSVFCMKLHYWRG